MLNRHDSIFKEFNPEGKQFLRPHQIQDGIVALTVDGLPHIKTIPAFVMMLDDYNKGLYDGVHTIVIDSSGNTGHGGGRLAPAFDMDVIIVLALDVPAAKRAIIETLPRVEVIAVAGNEVAAKAIELGNRPGYRHINQYRHEANVRAHELYTGPEIIRALGGVPPDVVAIAMGSAGTISGVGRYLKKHSPGTKVIGVRPELGQRVPGARDEKKMEAVVTFPWQEVTDVVIEVSRRESFEKARDLWNAVEPQPGPTSGLAYAGLLKYLSSDDRKHRISVFLCPDSAYLYPEVFKVELDL